MTIKVVVQGDNNDDFTDIFLTYTTWLCSC